MLHVYEFEIFQEEGLFVALPFCFEGGTQGETFEQACEMAAEWLQAECEQRALHDEAFPPQTFGNAPRNGGKTVIVAVNAGRETIAKVRASRAAEMLGVTRGRVSQMVSAGLLDSWKEDGTVWVTRASVQARLKDAPKPGRPKKTVA